MKVRIAIERFDPVKDTDPRLEWHEVEIDERATLLDVLMKIESSDPSLAIPYSCRRGVCGSCTVEVNGVAIPACSTPVTKLVECLGAELVVKPLRLLPRTRDLVVDRSKVVSYLDKYRYWIHRIEPYIPPERMDPTVARDIQAFRKCSLCLACLGTCPVKSVDRSFGGMLSFRIVAERSSDPRDAMDRLVMALKDGLYNCLMCDACTSVCPHEIDCYSAVLTLRKRAWERGLAPIKIRDAVEAVLDEEYGNPLWMPRIERGEWLRGFAPSSKAEVLVFAGCMASYVDRQSVVALVRILELMGVSYASLGSREHCCGMPLLLAGDIEDAKRIAEKNVAMFKELGIKKIVTPCPSCYHMFKSIYPKLGVELEDIEVIHAALLVAEALDRGALRPRRRLNIVATYHDPCDLGRHEGVFEEPRMVIENTVKEFIEMKRRKWFAQCCGAGGNVRISNPELSLAIAVNRLKRDLPKNVEVVVHACPTCRVQLEEASEKIGLRIKHISLQELVLQTLFSD